MRSKAAGDDCMVPRAASLTPEALWADPYPYYRHLHERSPIAWVDGLKMWYVVRYSDVRAILLDRERFATSAPTSPVFDTFGLQMLTCDGDLHDRYRRAFQPLFSPQSVKRSLEPEIGAAAARLIDAVAAQGRAELRSAFAARLPIQAMLLAFGLPENDEPRLRTWYDGFEQALANFTGDPRVRELGKRYMGEFMSHVQGHLEGIRMKTAGNAFLESLLGESGQGALGDEEIIRNVAISFFGGISTVEALILNSLWALLTHPDSLERVQSDPTLLPKVIDETIRWLSPVQSATRHVTRDVDFGTVRFRAGDTIACMLGAANRDPDAFADPDRFDIDRCSSYPHLGFAAGPHFCLGFMLAKAEARAALQVLFERLGDLRLLDREECEPRGFEFRQPQALRVGFTAR